MRFFDPVWDEHCVVFVPGILSPPIDELVVEARSLPGVTEAKPVVHRQKRQQGVLVKYRGSPPWRQDPDFVLGA